MNKNQITAEIVADSLSPQGDRLISVLCTFPRIILSEMNTHRMLSKNTSSSRAIPFNKMVEAVQNNPFIPIAWQKVHSGMQGSDYEIDEQYINQKLIPGWLEARDSTIHYAQGLNNMQVTKQLCNRLLEPFMWTTMLITGPLEGGWDNFFNLRCPNYEIQENGIENVIKHSLKSKKEFVLFVKDYDNKEGINNEEQIKDLENYSELDWLKINKGMAEIHIMDLAEKIYDATNESIPKQLKAGEWHIPFEDKIILTKDDESDYIVSNVFKSIPTAVKISVAMAAKTSYTVIGTEKGINYETLVELHDRLLVQDPPHSSPMEHCARCMDEDEYVMWTRGKLGVVEIDTPNEGQTVASLKLWNTDPEAGWCRNFKGFIPYRHIIETK